MTELLPEGTRVILRADSEWIADNSNPKEDSLYFCEGTLRHLKESGNEFVYAVDWDNGAYNHYKAGCLKEIDERIPV